ncbi:MAG: NAD(P)/FAD-dependent oxidoreductase [Nocardioidaceae bacterium]
MSASITSRLLRWAARRADVLPGDDLTRRRVVIIGGGFAGLFAARGFRGAPVRITLIDRTAHHLFQPLLYQVATGVLSEGKVAVPLRSALRYHFNVDCLMADVDSVDVDGRQVHAVRPGGEALAVPYDDLIVAAGVRSSYFGHDEFSTHAPGMKTLQDALTIRRKIFGAFEMAQTATEPEERRRWQTFAVVGAGPTGVELAGQIRELATLTLRWQYDRIRPQDARVLLFDGGDAPLAQFGPHLSARARNTLEKLGVELHMRSLVTNVDEQGLMVREPGGDTTRFPSATILWTAGVAAAPLADQLARATGADQDRAGRIRVRPDLTLPGHPEISVVGDMMSLNDLPGVAEVAMQSGLYAAGRLRRSDSDAGSGSRPFRYHDLGSAAYIARGNAVISFHRLHAGGWLGWAGWLLIHLTFLTGFRNRGGAVITWLLTFGRETRPERAFTMPRPRADFDRQDRDERRIPSHQTGRDETVDPVAESR